MTFDKGLLEKQAEAASKKGMSRYKEFWQKEATKEERDYLQNNGFHDTFKDIASSVK